jgi:hypothetical protein
MITHLQDSKGNSYRLLQHGEVILEGDEVFGGFPDPADASKCCFKSPENAWFTIGKGHTGRMYNSGCSVIRRRIVDATQP